jgi:hypothetical protein
MPALMLDVPRPSECPDHGAVYAIWLDGYYGRWSEFHERTIYTCVRYVGGKKVTHRFVPAMICRHPTEHVSGSGVACKECWHIQERHEGPPATVESTFTVPETARLLLDVGQGTKLRYAAAKMRAEALRRHGMMAENRSRPKLELIEGTLPDVPLAKLEHPIRPPKDKPARHWSASGPRRGANSGIKRPGSVPKYNYATPKEPRSGEVLPSNSASVAMDYIDRYGPVVLEDIKPTHWPRCIALDSLPIRRKGWRDGAGVSGGFQGGEIMVAANCNVRGQSFAFHARLGGGKDKDSWIDFFESLENQPRWIVADRDSGLAQAVEEHWPGTILFACEGHLRDNMRDAARADNIEEKIKNQGPVFDEIRQSLFSPESWLDFVATVDQLEPERSANLRKWINDNEAEVLRQFPLKDRFPDAPFGNGAVEGAIRVIKKELIPTGQRLRNLFRLNLRLALMCAIWSHKASERTYITALRRADAHPNPDWAAGRDFGGSRSIDDFLAVAAERRLDAQARRSYNIKSARLSEILAERNAQRRALGLPLIELGPLPKPKKRESRDVAGYLVRYDDLVIEFHPTRNGNRTPGTVRCNEHNKVWWRCSVDPDHEWDASPYNRVKKATGCRFCTGHAVDPKRSFAARFPEVAAEWDYERNGTDRPEDFLPASNRETHWICKKGHRWHTKIYERTSPRMLHGCKECHDELEAAGLVDHRSRAQRERAARTKIHDLEMPDVNDPAWSDTGEQLNAYMDEHPEIPRYERPTDADS